MRWVDLVHCNQTVNIKMKVCQEQFQITMVLDASLLNTQQYKVRIKGTVEQSMERSSALSYTSV